MDSSTHVDAQVDVAFEYLQCASHYSGMVTAENYIISKEMVEVAKKSVKPLLLLEDNKVEASIFFVNRGFQGSESKESSHVPGIQR